MKIYQIDSSARKEGSTSRALAKKLLNKIKKPEDEVIYRDLNDEMVFVSGLTESGMNIDLKDQNENHKKMFELSNQLVKELKESDIIIISAPIYNYGPPATLKAWSDIQTLPPGWEKHLNLNQMAEEKVYLKIKRLIW